MINSPNPPPRFSTDVALGSGPRLEDATADVTVQAAETFESFVANQEVREDRLTAGPIPPIIALSPERFPDDARVVEMLDLLPLLRKRCRFKVPGDIVGLSDFGALAETARGREFGFSPVAPQQRLGIATPTDFHQACKRLHRMGFKRISSGDQRIALTDAAAKAKAGLLGINDCWVICDSEATVPQREFALWWSQGLVRLLDGPDAGIMYSTNFLPGGDERDRIGTALDDPHVGDCRSPRGRCLFCSGTGRLPTYPLDLIIADGNSTVLEDSFWHPAILNAIRGLRRMRIVPEARFFAGEMVADFLQPYQRMCERTAFIFENGIPWRRFLKPTAKRSDRIQDYYSWRGLHDYVYLVISKVEERHRQRLKDGFQQQPCRPCMGSGVGWEAGYLRAKETNLLNLLASHSLAGASRLLDIHSPAVEAALEFGLGEVGLHDRFADLSPEQRSRLAMAAACAAPLENLSLMVQHTEHLDARQSSKLLAKQGMFIRSINRNDEPA